MKKTLALVVCGLLWVNILKAQQTQYMVFEFIKVEKDHLFDYIEFKDLMEKVYRQALNDKRIKGWDFWRVQRGFQPAHWGHHRAGRQDRARGQAQRHHVSRAHHDHEGGHGVYAVGLHQPRHAMDCAKVTQAR